VARAPDDDGEHSQGGRGRNRQATDLDELTAALAHAKRCRRDVTRLMSRVEEDERRRRVAAGADRPPANGSEILVARKLHADLVGARQDAARSHRRDLQQHLLALELAERLMLERFGADSWQVFHDDIAPSDGTGSIDDDRRALEEARARLARAEAECDRLARDLGHFDGEHTWGFEPVPADQVGRSPTAPSDTPPALPADWLDDPSWLPDWLTPGQATIDERGAHDVDDLTSRPEP
jgi:hypothetical protein